jgi:hypothetical protein
MVSPLFGLGGWWSVLVGGQEQQAGGGRRNQGSVVSSIRIIALRTTIIRYSLPMMSGWRDSDISTTAQSYLSK